MDPIRVGDLEIDQDLDFERREWAVQRVGWVLMALVVVAALLGAFGGPGPLSSAVLDGGGSRPLRIEYERLGRLDHATTITARFAADAGGSAAVWLDPAYHEAMLVEHVDPRPSRVVTHPDRVEYVFDTGGGGVPLNVVFHLSCERAGTVRGRIGRPGGEPVSFTQFVYP